MCLKKRKSVNAKLQSGIKTKYRSNIYFFPDASAYKNFCYLESIHKSYVPLVRFPHMTKDKRTMNIVSHTHIIYLLYWYLLFWGLVIKYKMFLPVLNPILFVFVFNCDGFKDL